MMTNCNASKVFHFGRNGRTFLACVFALMMTHNALPVFVVHAQDNRTGQDRDSSVAQPQPSEIPQRANPDAPGAGGPPVRLSLDQAVDRLERNNLALAAMWLEVLQARADILTAWQRPNSRLLIGGGKDGPLRLRSLEVPPKLWARALAARLAPRVTEAQYRDAVRNHTADLYTAYVNVQEARLQSRYARKHLEGVESLLNLTKDLAERGQIGRTDLGRVAAMQVRATLVATDADIALQKARVTLAGLLNIADAQADRLEVSELTEDLEQPLPDLGELTRLALSHRPDLQAHRLGLWRAQAGSLWAWVEQLPDLYILDQPNRPGRADAGGRADALPGASGLVVSLLDSGHYQGRVARARINVAKWRIELERVERQIVLDVRQAQLEYTHNLAARRRLKEEVLPSAKNVRDDTLRLFQSGEADVRSYLSAQSEYNDVVGDYLKAAIRSRRAALALNTAVGKRVLPEPP
jgi:outer membrane protein, heavy metal efflux system